MRGRKIIIFLSIILTFILLFPNVNIAYAASSKDYAVMIGDEDNEYTLYEDLVILKSKEIMLKAEEVCELLDLFYDYDESSKKLRIEDEETGDYLEFTRNSKDFAYYSDGELMDRDKAKYKCYYDTKSKSMVIHYETLNYLVNCRYFYITESNKYTKTGYKHFVFISRYDTLDELPKAQIRPIPTYETNLNTLSFGSFYSSVTYRKHISTDILNDIKVGEGIFSGENGQWYQIFYLMYDKNSVPSTVECWKDSMGRITFILPNGNQYNHDNCYAVLVANNVDDDEVRNAFFYGTYTTNDLLKYLESNGPDIVKTFIKQSKQADYNFFFGW